MNTVSIRADTPRCVASILDGRATWLLARIALTLPYWWSGIDKATHPDAPLAEIARLRGISQPVPAFRLLLLVQLGGSALVIFNRWNWLGAGALVTFTLIVTILVHAFWKLDGSARFAETNTFLEHMALIAGFVFTAMRARENPNNTAR